MSQCFSLLLLYGTYSFHILSSSNPICLTMRERYSLPYLWGFGVSAVDAALPQEVQFTPALVRHIFTVKHSEAPNFIHVFSAENSLLGKLHCCESSGSVDTPKSIHRQCCKSRSQEIKIQKLPKLDGLIV